MHSGEIRSISLRLLSSLQGAASASRSTTAAVYRHAWAPAARGAPLSMLPIQRIMAARGVGTRHMALDARHHSWSEQRFGFNATAALGLGAAVVGLGYLCGGSESGGMATALSAAALLNGALLAHEAGHLAAARALGVAVQEFAVGVGPRVAWWQGATTTYSLRAFPIFGYVSFLTASHLGTAAAAGAAAAAGTGAARGLGGFGRGSQPPLLLLEWLSPGRRALVMVAGVATNALLAAAFVAWQVTSYGELGVVVRPGARVRAADGWEGDADGTAQRQQQGQQGQLGQPQGPTVARERLRAGDVVLRVGGVPLMPIAGGDMDVAFVRALEVAAAASHRRQQLLTAATAGNGASSSSSSSSSSGGGGGGDVASLDGVKLTVLRSHDDNAGGSVASSSGSSSSSSSSSSRQEVLELDASDVLRYENLVVGPNKAAGYRQPASASEAVAMTARELTSWAAVVLGSWAEAVYSAASFASTSNSSSSGSSSGSSSSNSSSSGGGSSHLVGPLGLVASAAAVAVAADRQSRAPSCYCASDSPAAASMSSPSPSSDSIPSTSSSPAAVAADLSYGSYDDKVRQPPPLLELGIQLNLQLMAVNLLPLPVLDGGQLILVALEAARGGRRLPATVERAALLGSGLLVGCWILALSVADIMGLASSAAEKLGATLASTANGRSQSPYQQQQQHDPATSMPIPASAGGRMQVTVAVAGVTSSGAAAAAPSRGFAADAATAMDASTGAWAL